MRILSKNASASAKRPRRRRGGSSVEYLLILALVVIPIALLAPVMIQMIKAYTNRIALVIRLPFG